LFRCILIPCLSSVSLLSIICIMFPSPGMVTVLDEQRHGLQTGDRVTFEEVEGMSEVHCTARARASACASASEQMISTTRQISREHVVSIVSGNRSEAKQSKEKQRKNQQARLEYE
jgi:hypothetical protein